MESKTEICKDCIYFQEGFLLSLDCGFCIENSNFLSLSELEQEANKQEENKPQYFLIKWLICELLKALNEEMTTYFGGIVRKPIGDKQNSSAADYLPFWLKPFFLKEWCDQWRNGGYTGDDYAGDIYLKLMPFVYLKFEYQC